MTKPVPTVGVAPKVVEDLSEGERYLYAILQDKSGLDQAEFLWHDATTKDGCWRAWSFQWAWFRCTDTMQIDQSGRSIGKSLSIKLRGFAFPILYPGQEMVITAPELNHLEPIVGLIENQIYSTRLTRELLMRGRSAVTHRPFQMNFVNDARIIGRIPQRDGKGVKGIHPIWLEMDEAQDYPHAGWTELTETLKEGFEDKAIWRSHGVTRGVQDDFWKFTQDSPDNQWTVHRFQAMWRPTWTDEERQRKIKQYGSADDPDYRRNVLGLHGDATSPIFVAHRLFRCADDDPTSDYNVDEYFNAYVKTETLRNMNREIVDELDFPARHLKYLGPEQRRNPRAVFWIGMDVGMTVDPSEILVFVEYRDKPTDPFSKLRLLTRISMIRMGHSDQVWAILHAINFYKPKVFAMDKGGLGLPFLQEIQEYAETDDQDKIPAYLHKYDLKGSLAKIKGYNFCTDEETEILTKRGWLRYDQVRVGDETLGLTTDGTSRWTPITAVNVFDGPHEVHRLEGQAHSSVTTASHRWLAKPHTSNNKLRWVSTEELATSHIRYGLPVAAIRADNPTAPTIKDDVVELAAWFFTEGWSGGGSGTINIGQSLTASSLECRRIEALLSRLMGPGQFNPGRGNGTWGEGWTCSNSPSQYRGRDCVQNTYHVKDRQICATVLGLVIGEDKVPSPEFLTSLTDEQLDLFIEVCMLGDGSETLMARSGRTDRMTNFFHQENEARSRAFEMAVALRGHGFTHRRYKNQSTWCTNRLSRRQVWSSCMEHEKRTIEGIVWCPTTTTGTWLARRDGTVYFTGNSEKITVDFDDTVEIPDGDDQALKDAMLKRNTKEYSTDVLRRLVDSQRIELPWDDVLLKQFQGGTISNAKGMDQYGHKRFNKGDDHTLDAARFMALGWAQFHIEELLAKKHENPPIFAQFVAV